MGLYPELFVSILLPANLLILAAPRLRQRDPSRPYWLGFELAGWASVVGFVGLAFLLPNSTFEPLRWLEPIFARLVARLDQSTVVVLEIAVIAVVYSAPLLLLAHLGGRLSRRYRVRLVVERRPG